MTSRGLHADELDRVFPFHVVIDRGLRVVQLGRSLVKLIPELGVGASLFDHCTLQRPRETLTYEVLRDRGLELCVLAARGSRLVLKGQIIARPDTETLLFLGSPRVTAAEELAQLGLTINDFAIHDAIVDFLFLSHGQQSALAEVREIADRLATIRARDARQNVALESALADARRELADRRRAEAEGAQLRDQLMHAQKMEAVGTLAGGFAHDMNNVLTSILGVAELLREDIPPAFHEDLDGILESTQRGAELTRNLLGFARRGKYRRERVELGTVVGELVKLLARTVPKGVTFAVDVPRPGPSVEGDPTLITQALVNLCLNSVDAMRGVGRVTISANQVELGAERATALEVTPGCYVEIGVTDSGSGMDAATIQRIFEPFFTTKDIGRGTGLGLPMVYGTVRSHDGAIEVSSTVGTGTTMRLYLPAVDAITVQEVPKPTPMPFVVTTSGTILVVDDDDRIRRVSRRILEGRGYRVLEVGDGRAALELYKKHPEVDLVVLDMAMPVMGGAECFAALRLFDPNARVLLASGYTIEEDARRCLANGAVGFVDKPYTVDTLVTAVTRAMRGERQTLQKGES